MELCNAIPSAVKSTVIPCLLNTSPYVRQPYDSNSVNYTPPQVYSYSSILNDQSAVQNRSSVLQYNYPITNSHPTSISDGARSKFAASAGLYSNISQQAQSMSSTGERTGAELFNCFKSISAMDPWMEMSNPEQSSHMMSKLKNGMHPTTTELLKQHLAQWDVNDPKLPKIRQFDAFTMWPQGNCRLAYQKSASDGTRRHASGWAMRNTNNHNAVILKKSCLGVLLCSSKRCSMAMRPAICDKARRRQEGRPCCIPNCTGTIYNQPCRGHGGYPVTHFWREHGDTVYFQAKGTHDHVRPDLKPVRDTAARRRRQLQMDKLERNRMGSANQVKQAEKLETFPALQTNRVRNPNVIERKIPQQQHLIRPDFTVPNDTESLAIRQAFGEHWKANQINCNEDRTLHNEKNPAAEPIFPGILAPSTELEANSHYDQQSTKLNSLPMSPTLQTRLGRKPREEFNSLLSNSLTTPLEKYISPMKSSLPNYTRPDGNNSFMKELYEQDLKSHLPFQPTITDSNQNKWGFFPHYQSADLLPISLYRQQQHQTQSFHTAAFMSANQTVGGNSESTSGGLNASWSTPSPPTGGNNSSLFGNSDFRIQVNGYEETTPLGPTTPLVTTTAPAWRLDQYAIKREDSSPKLTGQLATDYGLATPTHPYGSSNNSGSNSTQHSPENLLTTSILMSASTPLSGTRQQHPQNYPNMLHQLAQSAYYPPTGYITPISSFQLHDSSTDSQHTTRTQSSSNGSNCGLSYGVGIGDLVS